MSQQWVLALTGLGAEPMVVTRVSGRRPTVRRVTDLVELLAVAQPALADGVLVSARFPQMNRDVAQRLARSGLPVWGLFDPGDDVGQRMIQEWGISAIAARADCDVDSLLAQARPPEAAPSVSGSLVAVTGPAGAPGRSTVALNLAAEWAGASVLVDADNQAPSLGFQLGVCAEAPGTRGAGRQSAAGRLNPATFARACHDVQSVLLLSAGPSGGAMVGVDGLLDVCTQTRPVTVVDCGPAAGPVAGPVAEGGIGQAALARADVVVLVGSPTALGIRRLMDQLPQLRLSSGSPVLVVWNQLRTHRQHGGLGADPLRRLTSLVHGVAPGSAVAGLPWDPRAVARTVSGTLRQRAPRSALRQGIVGLATSIERSWLPPPKSLARGLG